MLHLINQNKINWRTILLGLALNILVVIIFILIYHAYIIRPRIDTAIHIPEIPAEANVQEIIP